MTKIIKFTATSEEGYQVQERPFPASQAIPQWWRDEVPYQIGPENPDGKKIIVDGGVSNASFKKCTPMLDALTSGYIIPLWSDVQVRMVDGYQRVTWRTTTSGVFELHGPTGLPNMEAPEGYKTVFKYSNTWIPETPPGYSVLITAPFGYRNLPFHAIPAVIDSDKSTLEVVPPMWLREGFEGIVEKGTPMFQVTPFKRENWKAEFGFRTHQEHKIIVDKNFGSTLVNHYVRNVWSKKSYK